MAIYKILQGLGLVQAYATERWPLKVEKATENLFFLL